MQFAETFKRLRVKSDKSRYKLAQYSGLSEPYILRLESGEPTNPSRDVVMMLGRAFRPSRSGISMPSCFPLITRPCAAGGREVVLLPALKVQRILLYSS